MVAVQVKARRILDITGTHDIANIGFDRTFAGEVVQNLMEESVPMVEFGQGFLSMGSRCCRIHADAARWNAAARRRSRGYVVRIERHRAH
jgi:phage terminase large subunit-like protein